MASLPGIFSEHAIGPRRRVPVPQLLGSSLGIVHYPGFVRRRVLRKLQQVIEGKLRLRPRALEGLDVISVPALVPESKRVGTAHVREHVAPVIIVLDEVTLSEANAVCRTGIRVDSVHRDTVHRVILGSAAQHALNSALPSRHFIHRGWRESMCPGSLARNLP